MGAQQSYYYPSSIADQTGKVVLITGANVGLGLAAAEHFVRHNAHVILACRSVENGRKAKEHLVNIFPLYGDRIAVEQLDLSDLASVLACANRVKQQQKQLNALVNNAAVIPATRQLSKQGFEMQFAVQHLGHFVLTRELLPLLKATPGSRLCVVSSSVHKWVKQPLNFDEIVYRQNSYSQTAYPESKLMNMLFARALHRRLKEEGASSPTVVTCDPGFCVTQLGRESDRVKWMYFLGLGQEAWQGALNLVRAATDDSVPALSFVSPTHGRIGKISAGWPDIVPPSPLALDDDAAEKLWTLTEKLLAVEEAKLKK